MKKYILIFLLIHLFYSCEDGESKIKNQNKFQNEFLITLLKYREEGNCKKTVTSANNIDKTITCNRKPRGFCNLTQSIVTQGDVNFLFSEAKKVRDRTPECENSFIQSGILLTVATSKTDEENIRSKHDYQTISTCEDDGFTTSSAVRLATFSELLLLESARGRIGRSARIIGLNFLLSFSIRESARLCLEKEFTESERSFFSDVVSGKVVIEINK